MSGTSVAGSLFRPDVPNASRVPGIRFSRDGTTRVALRLAKAVPRLEPFVEPGQVEMRRSTVKHRRVV
jgi:hypothetical protein